MNEDRTAPTSGKLFAPGKIGPLRLRNRTLRSAAFEGMSAAGRPSAGLLRYHRDVAAGGVGLTTVAYTAVTPGGRTFDHQLWMRPEIVPDLRLLTDLVHREGAAASIQLGDAGNMADRHVTGKRPVAPSAVFNLFGLTLPRALTPTAIGELVQAFGAAARLARDAGFDAIEIQGGHGYLISQFLSPSTNRRDDAWGGSLANRARLLRDVVREVRRAVGSEMAVLVKVNLRDGFRGGIELEDSITVARMLEAEGVDALVLSGGFVSRCPWYVMRGEVPLREMVATQRGALTKLGLLLFGRFVVKPYPFTEAYFLADALRLRQAVQLPLVLVGGLRSAAVMERVLAQGIDFVALARPLLFDPGFVGRLQRGELDTSPCEPCNRCVAAMYFGPVHCPLAAG